MTLKQIVNEPMKYVRLIPKVCIQYMSIIFDKTSFYLQGQMDIHPSSRWYSKKLVEQTGGFFVKDKLPEQRIMDLESWDNTRKDMLILLLRTIQENNIIGDFAELGVYKGNTAKLIHHYAPRRKLYLFDTFEGFTKRGIETEKEQTGDIIAINHFSDTSLESVKKNIKSRNNNIYYNMGFFPDSIPEALNAKTFAFVHLDADLYEPILEGLKFFYPRMSKNAMIVIHDYNAWIGSRLAVDDFFKDKKEMPIPMPDKSGSALVIIQK